MEHQKSCCSAAAGAHPVVMPSAVGGPFSLVDHHGANVTADSWRGRHRLMFFGFTHCQVVCPRALQRIGDALSLLGTDATQLAVLYVSVDPERDTPAAMRRYLSAYPSAITGLTGTREQVDAAVKAFRVFARRTADADAPGGYVVPHTAITYLMGPDGNYLAHFSDAIDAAELARRLRPWLIAERPGAAPD